MAEVRPSLTWAHLESNIPVDEKVVTGQLSNGMRYLLYPNPEPPGRVSIRLHVNAGSLMEEEDQRGMAHFLEHMVFEGSENYSSEELIPEMQRLGIAFGAHANAYTSFDETVYMLDLPNLKEDTLQLAFTVMRDFADGALLLDEEVEAERGVILSEKNSRDSVDFRLMQKQFKYLFPSHLASQRMPIGTEECIKTTPRSRIKDFYDQYYVPERMTLIIVGDVDLEAFEERIKKNFASLKPLEDQVEPPALGSVEPPTQFRAAVFSDKEVDEEDLSLMRCTAHQSRPDTRTIRREELSLSMANVILTKRFSELARGEGSPINTGAAYINTWFDEITFGSVSVTPSEGKWREAVEVLEQSFRQTLEHGFTVSEFKEASAEFLKEAKVRLSTSSTRLSAGIAGQIVQSLNDRRVFSTPQTDYELLKKTLETLSAEEIHQAFRTFWGHEGLNLILTTSEKTPSTQDELLALYRSSRSKTTSPPQDEAAISFAYADKDLKGAITAQTHDEALDIHQLTFANGVRANLKKTPFEKDTISLLVSFGDGQMGQPISQPGLSRFAEAVFLPGGLKKHSQREIQRLLTERRANQSFQVAEDHFVLRGMTNQEDLLFQLQLLSAFFREAGYRDEALRQYQKAVPDMYDQLRHTLAGPLAEFTAWLRGGDPRFVLPSEEQALSLKKEELIKWLEPQLKSSALEVNLVGDFDLTTTKRFLAKTFGALSQRSEKHVNKTGPSLDLPAVQATQTFTYKSELDRAASVVSWKTRGLRANISEARKLSLASRILSDRLREEVREKLGSTYSPSARSEMSEAFPEFGHLTAFSIAKPEDLSTISTLVVEIGQDLATSGATQDELERALNPVLESLQQSLRQNSYWLESVLNRSSTKPQKLQWAKSRQKDYHSISLGELNALFEKYLTAQSAQIFHLRPKKQSK